MLFDLLFSRLFVVFFAAPTDQGGGGGKSKGKDADQTDDESDDDDEDTDDTDTEDDADGDKGKGGKPGTKDKSQRESSWQSSRRRGS